MTTVEVELSILLMKFWLAIPLLLILSLPGHGRTLDDVRASGVLACGLVGERPGFAVRDKDYQWSGFDVDICRAIAAGVVGDGRKVNFVDLQEAELVVALQSGEVDVLPRGQRLAISTDTSQGLMLAAPTFFEIDQHGDLAIYGPIVRQGDSNWLQVVQWTVWCLTRAESLGVGAQQARSASASSSDARQKFLAAGQSFSALGLGLDKGWIANVIGAVGNYGEIFERHFGATSPHRLERGMNKLAKDGGLLLSPPFD